MLAELVPSVAAGDITLIKTEDTIKKIVSAMGLPTSAPQPWPTV